MAFDEDGVERIPIWVHFQTMRLLHGQRLIAGKLLLKNVADYLDLLKVRVVKRIEANAEGDGGFRNAEHAAHRIDVDHDALLFERRLQLLQERLKGT